MGVETAAVKSSAEIPGLKGMEKLNTIPALKEGNFHEFLDKVLEIRRDPLKEKSAYDEIKKIDDDKTLSANDKKAQLRAIDRTKLFATIGKNIEFGENSLEITLDFDGLDFAEKQAIGAGDILPSSIKKIAFEKKQNAKLTVGERTVGPNGREYRSKNRNYIASYTGTKLIINYKDILPITKEQERKIDAAEKKGEEQAAETVGTSKKAAEALKKDVGQKPQAQAKTPETNEVGVSHQPVFIGDSQMEGMGGYYLRGKGIDVIDLRSMRMESIARTLKDPTKIDMYYAKKSKEFIERRKNRIISGREKLKTADSIVLQCGGNNIAANQSLEKMQASLQKLIGTIRTFNTSAPLYVGTIMVKEGVPETATSRQYNMWLKEQASKGAFRIMDSEKIVKESGIVRPAGVHLDRENYIHLSKEALKAINYQKV
ncbi:MAG: SGNH/GDSL hydrolase family protein [Candidatus Peregrinibacteria bacterium]|nr:SGNH/GDSL hydrolase family protein [Candidatus Peregrinibacteria bacterium]